MKKLIKTKSNKNMEAIRKSNALQSIYDDVCIANNFVNNQKPCRGRFRNYLVNSAKTKYKEYMSSGLELSKKDIKRVLNPKCKVIPLTIFDFIKVLLLSMPDNGIIEGMEFDNLSICMVGIPIDYVKFFIVQLNDRNNDLKRLINRSLDQFSINIKTAEIEKNNNIIKLCKHFINLQNNFDDNNKVNDNKYIYDELHKYGII